MLPPQFLHAKRQAYGPDAFFLRQVSAAVQAQGCSYGFGVAQLAETLDMSTTHLGRNLLRLTGMSPAALLKFYRMGVAQRYLRSTRMTVKEVAYASGYNEPAAFCRFFKAVTGVSPSEYRDVQQPPAQVRVYRLSFPVRQRDLEAFRQLCKQHRWLAQALTYIGGRLFEGSVEVPVLAERLHVSTVQLNRRCKKVVGLPPGRLIRYLRLQESAYRLLHTNEPVTNLALDLGFFDAPHFCRVFEELYGCTPSSFRAEPPPEMAVVSVEEMLYGLK